METRIILFSIGANEASEFARNLVEQRYVACANVLPGVQSIYIWDGRLCEETEVLVLCETIASRLDDVVEHIATSHPYDCPKVLALKPNAVWPLYAQWVANAVASA